MRLMLCLVPFASGRAVRELEAQLEYERVRREKLESQLDGYRAEIRRLRESLENTRLPAALPAVSAPRTPLARGAEAAARCSFPRVGVRRTGPNSFQQCPVTGQGATGTN